MSNHVRPQSSYFQELSETTFNGYSVIQKFGRNEDVGTSFEPVALGGIYRTPQVAGATALRIKAGNINDTSNGTGARTVTLEGIDENGDLVTETLSTNGTSASTATTATFLRLYRAYVATSGTYATASAGSHSANVVIENSAGTEDWAIIDAATFPSGQTEIGAYTVPNGYEAYVKNMFIHVETAKPATILFFQRQNILQTAAPYSAMREVFSVIGAVDAYGIVRETSLGPFPALTDIGFMAVVAATAAQVSVNFEIILKEV